MYPNGKTQVVRVPVPVQPARVIPPGVPPLPGGPGSDADPYADEWSGNQGVWARLVWATPEWCQLVLDNCNKRNRKFKAKSIAKVKRAVEEGLWTLNGESVVFANTGMLVDGQNRLKGISEAGVPVPLLVVFGVHPDAFFSHGECAPRTRADVLSVPTDDMPGGEVHANTLSACLTLLYRWENGLLSNFKAVPQNSEMPGLIHRHPGIRGSIAAVRGRCQHGVHTPSVFAFLHYLFTLKDAEMCELFMQRVLDGIGVEHGSNEAILNRWLKNKAGGYKHQSFYTQQIAVVIKTWNRVREGQPAAHTLVFKDDEQFPEIK